MRPTDDEREAMRVIADISMVVMIEMLSRGELAVRYVRDVIETRDRLGYTNVFRWAHRRSRWRDD